MERLVLIDGNSIMNRAFYGIMGSKVLSTKDGKYTNAVYGFLAIMFKIMEDLNPKYMVVSFDLKAPTERHKMYEGYKANRHGMPEELAYQMPMIKEILKAMNIEILEKEGYEGDDILGTLAKYGEKKGLEVTILSGDRDTFQLASDHITIRIPRTKAGKTETDDYNREKVIEEYGVEPQDLIEVKGLQGDTSDNIPGVPGIGPKSAISLIQKFKTIDNLYKSIEENIDGLKGKQRENLIENKDKAILSRALGKINTKVPIEDTLENFKVEEWNKEEVLSIFKELNFNRYIQRFNLQEEGSKNKDLKDLIQIKDFTLQEARDYANKSGILIYNFEKVDTNLEEKIIKKNIVAINILNKEQNIIYHIKISNEQEFINAFKKIFESKDIPKYGYSLKEDYIILKELGITMKNIYFDAKVAAYILNPAEGKYELVNIAREYLEIDFDEYLNSLGIEKETTKQITLFEEATKEQESPEKYKSIFNAYSIGMLYNILISKLEEIGAKDLFDEIEMPTVEVLADMQWNGIYIEKEELEEFGNTLKASLDVLTSQIYKKAGEEFNINSPKQLGEILFEKMKLPVVKKTKSGYSTDVDVLEKLKKEDSIIEDILDYRQLMKLNSTYVEGMKPYINPKTKRIHSFFHQTITATGRISSTEPNLQNIPTRIELGKRLRKVFKPEAGKVFIDADYSQIELRVLAHMSNDEHMVAAFRNNEDIHKQAASKVFGVPIEEVTKEQRSNAKAVNFGIVYGISDFGLGEQLGISRKKAKVYIDQYLSEYSGIERFMKEAIEEAREKGYAKTLYNRIRYIKELSSNNYMVRQFGERAAMNTPIQGTAADIMKIAMIRVKKELENRNLKSKVILQVHDEMMIEAPIEEKEEVKEIIKVSMENVATLRVPLIAEISEATNWYECK